MESAFAVVGGGMSGIAAMQSLLRDGHRAELIEADVSLGGRVGSGVFRGRTIEFGGKNIGRQYTRFRELVAAFGGDDYELFGINTSRQHLGRVVTLDSSSRLRSTASYLRGASPGDVLKLARHALHVVVNSANRFLGSPYFSQLAADRDAQLDQHFSPAFAAAVLRPMTVRMNGAEPDEAFVGNFGTNLGMWLDTFDQLTSGLSPVLARMESAMTVLRGRRVTSLTQEASGELTLHFHDGTARRYRGVILAVPARACSSIVEGVSPTAADVLREIRYFPVTVVVAEYARPVFTPERRAYVFAREHPLSNAGAYGMQDLETVRYTFSGRTAREWMIHASDDELVRTGEQLLSRYAPVAESGRQGFAVRRFDPGLCAYSRDHWRRLGVIKRALGRYRIALAGDYLQGASLEACVRSGQQAAASLIRHRVSRPSNHKEGYGYV